VTIDQINESAPAKGRAFLLLNGSYVFLELTGVLWPYVSKYGIRFAMFNVKAIPDRFN
jgi:hypothetical protein